MEKMRKRIGFDKSFIIESTRKAGGMAAFWRKDGLSGSNCIHN